MGGDRLQVFLPRGQDTPVVLDCPALRERRLRWRYPLPWGAFPTSIPRSDELAQARKVLAQLSEQRRPSSA